MPRASHRRRQHSWYKSRRWQKLRRTHLDSHPFCQCPKHDGKYIEGNVVDHIEPPMGDARKFWDPSNLQTLHFRCHNSWKQSAEWHTVRKEALERRRATVGCDEDGEPRDPDHHWNR